LPQIIERRKTPPTVASPIVTLVKKYCNISSRIEIRKKHVSNVAENSDVVHYKQFKLKVIIGF
jgi:hypothetical protein